MWKCVDYDTGFNLKSALLIVFCSILADKAYGQSCTNLYASDSGQTFDSHFLYGIFDYSANENRCWVIHADYDQVVYLDSVSFDLEDNCYSATSGDRVNIYDGDSATDTLDKTVCGNDGVHTYKTTRRYAYVEFKTDNSIQGSGFRMTYKNADRVEEDASTGLSIAVIIGIVIGSLVGIIIIIGVIICCIVVVASTKKRGGKVHNAHVAHTTVHTTRGYFPQQQPQQQLYGNPGYTGYGAGVVMTGQAVHTGQSVPPNAPPAQQHPVDSHGVPVAAVYKEPKCGIDNVN